MHRTWLPLHGVRWDPGSGSRRAIAPRGGTLIQASAYNACCAVYAPRYRQAHGHAFVRPSPAGDRAIGIAYADIVDAFCTLVDLWIESDNFSAVDPTHEQVTLVVRHLAGGTAPVYYNKRAWTPVVLVNTNGDCYCYGDPYGEAEWCLGNLFRSSLAEIFASAAFDRSVLAAEQRMALNCTSCKWFGSCSGYPIAEEHYNCLEGTPDGVRRCVVEPTLYDHIERRVRAIASRDEKGRLRALLAS